MGSQAPHRTCCLSRARIPFPTITARITTASRGKVGDPTDKTDVSGPSVHKLNLTFVDVFSISSGGRLPFRRARLQEGLPGELVQRGGSLLPPGRLRPKPRPGRRALPQRIQPAAGLHVCQHLPGGRACTQSGGHQLQHLGQRLPVRELLRHHHAAHGAVALPALLRSLHLRVSGVQTWRSGKPRLPTAG